MPMLDRQSAWHEVEICSKGKNRDYDYLEEHIWVSHHQSQIGKDISSLDLQLIGTMIPELPSDLKYLDQPGTAVEAYIVA